MPEDSLRQKIHATQKASVNRLRAQRILKVILLLPQSQLIGIVGRVQQDILAAAQNKAGRGRKHSERVVAPDFLPHSVESEGREVCFLSGTGRVG
jgi:hypothetical protein